jgi:hypothetical protein
VVVNEIEQSNDIDGNVPIPPDLMAIVHMPPSRDPEPEEVEQVKAELAVDAVKVAEENPHSRFTILDSPIKKPGVCALCTSPGGDGRQFVDFGKSVEWYGVVYFCTFCVSEAAALLGFAPMSNWTNAEHNLQQSISEVDDLYVDAKVKLDAAMVLLRDHLNGDCLPSVPADEISEAELVEPDNSDGSDSEERDAELQELELVVGDDGPPVEDESDSDELAPKQGSDDIPADSGDDKFTASGRRRRTTKPAR